MKSNNKRVAGMILCLLCLAALLAGCDPAAEKRPVDYIPIPAGSAKTRISRSSWMKRGAIRRRWLKPTGKKNGFSLASVPDMEWMPM